ncbi:MAG: GNAT family N-acetyltransferase [Gammaproteobacteria bacterium]|nr:GNAT family N-acetyltransferase [Gammaproteobacteria bacterium]
MTESNSIDTIDIRAVRPDDEAASSMIRALDEYQLALYPAESNHLDDLETLLQPNVYFVGAYRHSELIGIGAVKTVADYGEIKRVYVAQNARGSGAAKALMAALEAHLRQLGISEARLETGTRQPEALQLYHSLGYERTGPFGDYQEDPLSVFMYKDLNR